MPQAGVEPTTRGLGNQSGFLLFIDGVFYVLLSVGVVTIRSCCGCCSVGLLWARSVSTMLAQEQIVRTTRVFDGNLEDLSRHHRSRGQS